MLKISKFLHWPLKIQQKWHIILYLQSNNSFNNIFLTFFISLIGIPQSFISFFTSWLLSLNLWAKTHPTPAWFSSRNPFKLPSILKQFTTLCWMAIFHPLCRSLMIKEIKETPRGLETWGKNMKNRKFIAKYWKLSIWKSFPCFLIDNFESEAVINMKDGNSWIRRLFQELKLLINHRKHGWTAYWHAFAL